MRRRAEADLDRLKQVVRARGYYAGALTFDLDTSVQPARVVVRIEQGPAYHFDDLAIVGPDGREPPLNELYTPGTLGVAKGQQAVASAVADVDAKLVRGFGENGYPKARLVERRVVVDHADQTMDVTWVIDSGPQGKFGPVRFSGLGRVKEAFARRRIAFKQGDTYDIRKLERTRDNLIASSLFSTVRADVAAAAGPEGRFLIDIAVQNRSPRTLSVGGRYETDTGPAAVAGWEHRNLFGAGERLNLQIQAGFEKQLASADFRKPDLFGITNQDGLASVMTSNETVDAYDSKRVKLFGGLERRLSDRLVIGGGLQMEQANVRSRSLSTGQIFTQDYNLLGTPLFLRRDSSDDLLNPTRGTRLNLTLTPYKSLLGDAGGMFVQSRLAGSAYQRLTSSDRVVFAVSAAFSSTLGTTLEELPRDKRFYAGGGGSVRGYAYQHAGRIDRFGDPVGGLSAFESAFELRVKVTETIGVVPFLDAGSAYDQPFPQVDDVRFGTGLGLRYYSPVGPLRLDVATPLNRQRGDDAFQIYVSLGQAF